MDKEKTPTRLDLRFWNEIADKYPNVMAKFNSWLQDYQKEINWHQVFNDGKRWRPPTFFPDLPHEFQVGILQRFSRDMINGGIIDHVKGHVSRSIDTSESAVHNMFNGFEKAIHFNPLLNPILGERR